MLLSDTDIIEEMDHANIDIQPFDMRYLQPASYDFHLGPKLLVPADGPITLSHGIDIGDTGDYAASVLNERTIHERSHEHQFWLPPMGKALGHTEEILTLTEYTPIAADIAGCSSLGRWWLFVHCTAGFIDPGWTGQLTVELFNASPWWLRLWRGMKIGQIRFYETRSKPQRSYARIGHYANSMGVIPSKYAE